MLCAGTPSSPRSLHRCTHKETVRGCLLILSCVGKTPEGAVSLKTANTLTKKIPSSAAELYQCNVNWLYPRQCRQFKSDSYKCTISNHKYLAYSRFHEKD